MRSMWITGIDFGDIHFLKRLCHLSYNMKLNAYSDKVAFTEGLPIHE